MQGKPKIDENSWSWKFRSYPATI